MIHPLVNSCMSSIRISYTSEDPLLSLEITTDGGRLLLSSGAELTVALKPGAVHGLREVKPPRDKPKLKVVK